MEELILINGQPIPENFPLRSLFYGEGVFETFRWKSTHPVFLNRHIERMKNGAEILRIPFPGEETILDSLDSALTAFQASDAYVKICLLSHGSSMFYENPEGFSFLSIVREYQLPNEPVKARVSDCRRSSTSSILRLKSLNYLESIYARREARELGFDDAIFLNERGEITEGTASNIFWFRDGVLYTPSIECGLLSGITRGLLVEIAEEIGMQVWEGCFNLESLLSSHCCFLTNSLIGVVAISQINDTKLHCDYNCFERIKASLFEKLGWVKDI